MGINENVTLGSNDTHTTPDIIRRLYYAFSTSASVLSIVGSSLLIVLCCKIRKKKIYSHQMLMFLSMCDLALALGIFSNMIWHFSKQDGNNTNINATDGMCQAQAALSSTASIASVFWTTFIALNIFLTARGYAFGRLHILTHVVSWGVPVIILPIGFHYRRYGSDPSSLLWCWVKRHPQDTASLILIWQLITGKLWEILAYITVFSLYISTKIHLASQLRIIKQTTREDSTSRPSNEQMSPNDLSTVYKAASRKLIFVPLVFVIARIWGSTRFILEIYDQGAADYLAPIQGFGDSAQGFLNCVVFVATTPTIKEQLFICLKRHQRTQYNKVKDAKTASTTENHGLYRSTSHQTVNTNRE